MTPASCKSSLYRSLNLYFLLTPFEQYFLKDKVNLQSATIRVLHLNQKMSDEGTGAAEQFTRELIDATLWYGGTHYLPYQRYPTGVRIRKAYRQLDAFVHKKAVYDQRRFR